MLKFLFFVTPFRFFSTSLTLYTQVTCGLVILSCKKLYLKIFVGVRYINMLEVIVQWLKSFNYKIILLIWKGINLCGSPEIFGIWQWHILLTWMIKWFRPMKFKKKSSLEALHNLRKTLDGCRRVFSFCHGA